MYLFGLSTICCGGLPKYLFTYRYRECLCLRQSLRSMVHAPTLNFKVSHHFVHLTFFPFSFFSITSHPARLSSSCDLILIYHYYYYVKSTGQVNSRSLCNHTPYRCRPARAQRLTAKALFEDLVIYPCFTRLGLTRGTGFQTHSHVCRAEGLNHLTGSSKNMCLFLLLLSNCLFRR